MEEKQKTAHEVVVFFDEERIVLPKTTWTGAELRAFFKVPSGNSLFQEVPGKHPDTLITPEMNIEVKNGDKFYDLPPGVKGSIC